MFTLSADSLLACWERGCSRHPLDRALLLYAIAAPDADPNALADQPIGQRNVALLQLRQALFGDALSCCVDCPNCEESLEFALSASTLLSQACEPVSHVEQDGMRFRMPTTRDLASVAHESDEAACARKLLLSLIEPDQPCDETAADLLAAALEQADACLDFALDFHCAACGHAWTASFDISMHLWREVEAHSRRLLDEVHILAREYGWTQREILSLSDTRRRSYIERALA